MKMNTVWAWVDEVISQSIHKNNRNKQTKE